MKSKPEEKVRASTQHQPGLYDQLKDWLLPRGYDTAPKRAALLLRLAGRAAAFADLSLPAASQLLGESYEHARTFRDKIIAGETGAHVR